MGDIWLAGYEFIDVLGDGGSNADAPFRVVLHTTEGPSIEAACSVYRQKQASPQITTDPWARRRAQHVPLNRSAYALVNKPGGVETNREGAIQIEIVGRAAESHDWPDDVLYWIAEELVAIRRHFPVELVAPVFVGQESGYIARENAPQRMSADEWNAFGGVCGHQHVPENAHWDPGRLNIARVFEHVRQIESPAAPAVVLPVKEPEEVAAAFIYGSDLDAVSVDPDGALVARYYQGVPPWRKAVLGSGARVGAQPSVVRDYQGVQGRVDIFVEAAEAGLCHAWWVPADGVWGFEVLP